MYADDNFSLSRQAWASGRRSLVEWTFFFSWKFIDSTGHFGDRLKTCVHAQRRQFRIALRKRLQCRIRCKRRFLTRSMTDSPRPPAKHDRSAIGDFDILRVCLQGCAQRFSASSRCPLWPAIPPDWTNLARLRFVWRSAADTGLIASA